MNFALGIVALQLLSFMAACSNNHYRPEQLVIDLAGSSKRGFTANDLVSLDRLSSLSVSPDGHFGLFTRTKYNHTSNESSKTIELIDLSNNSVESVPKYKIVTLTAAQEGVSDSEPVWMDNQTVAFLRKTVDEPVAQIYSKCINDNADSPAKPLFEQKLALPVENLKFHLTGQFFTFTAEVYAESSMEETAKHDKDVKILDQSSAMVFDKLYFRHWDRFDNHKNSHVFVLPLGSLDPPYNVMFGLREHSCPIPPHGDSAHYALSPDGQWLLYASMAHFDQSSQAWSTETNIYMVPVLKHESKVDAICISCDMPKGAKRDPSFSPDGNFIAWLQMNTPQFEADKNNLMVLNRQNDRVIVLNSKWDRSIDSYIWSSGDAKTVYFTASDVAREKIFSADISRPEEHRLLFDKGTATGLSLVPGSNEIVFTHSSMAEPVNYFLINPRTLSVRRLSDFHSLRLEPVELVQAEEFWFSGTKGEKVMGWIMRPAGFDPRKKYPMAYLIHGGPQSSWSDSWSTRWNPQVYSGAGYVSVFINFHGSTGYGQAFTNSITKNWGSYPFEDIMKSLDFVFDKYPFIDRDRVAGLGASYGGYMINWLNGHTDGQFRCFVNHDGLFDLRSMYYSTEELYFPEFDVGGTPFESPALYDRWNPSAFVKNWRTPTLVIHGGKDYRVSPDQGFSTFTALQRQGVPSRLLYFPDENHWVLKQINCLRWYHEILDWIDQYTAPN